MVQEMDQGAIEGAMDVASDGLRRAMYGASDGLGSSSRSDGWCKRWIKEQ